MSDYTDQDTQRVRQQQASVGTATRPLSPQADYAQPALARRNNPQAVGLIVIGLILLIGNALGGLGRGGLLDMVGPERSGQLTGAIFFLTLSSCFLFFAFWRRIYGLLIPGCILAGFAAGLPLVSLTGGTSFFWGLAAGFLAILAIGRTMFNVASSWPVYPAVALFAVGMLTAAARLPALFTGALVWLPLLLIGAGLYLGRRNRSV